MPLSPLEICPGNLAFHFEAAEELEAKRFFGFGKIRQHYFAHAMVKSRFGIDQPSSPTCPTMDMPHALEPRRRWARLRLGQPVR
jgi:hypothetical protein